MSLKVKQKKPITNEETRWVQGRACNELKAHTRHC